MDRVTPPPTGYTVTTKQDVEEILATEADLLRSEGMDPRWPGFPDDDKAPGRTRTQ